MPNTSIHSAMLADAHAHLAAGRVREAALGYRAALDAAEVPTRVSALLGLTLIARRGGQLPQALRLAQAALEMDSASSVAWACYASLLHAAGQAADAQAAYLRALALPVADAAHFLPALTGLGDLQLAARRAPAAAACFQRALAIRPTSPAALHGLGTALALIEAFEPALACFCAAIERMPTHPESHFAAGYCAAKLSRHPEAIAHYQRAIRLRPGFAPAWGNLAVCLVADGRDYLAVPCFHQALAADPRLLSALLNFGNLLRLRKCFADARTCYERALAVDPACADVLIALSYLELESSAEDARFARAERWLAQVAAPGKPELNQPEPDQPRLDHPHLDHPHLDHPHLDHPELANARGILALARHSATGDLTHLDSAIAAFRRAAALGHKTADSNAGNALLRVGRVEEAIQAHSRSVALDPLHPGARYNLALSQLRAGDFLHGWANYEARLDFRDVHPRPRRFQQPRWRGEPLVAPRNRLFVYYEQGLGDTLQFARYLPLLAARGAQLIVEVQPPLLRLLAPFVASLGGQCIAAGTSSSAASTSAATHAASPAAIPAFDFHVPLLSLPLLFSTNTAHSIPPPLALRTASLAIAPGLPIALDERLPHSHPAALHLGLGWAGNPRYAADRDRSTTLGTLLPLLAQFPQHRWFSLQKGEAAGQLPAARAELAAQFHLPHFPLHFPLFDACSTDRDLADTAAVLAALDLVLTTDTVLAHLAGSLARPCWLLLPWQSDWRWMQSLPTTPWYPTLRLFRQPAPGDWSSLLASVAEELRATA